MVFGFCVGTLRTLLIPRRRHGSRGFTLVELLIVIAIIGIIATILIPNLLDALQRAKQRRTMSDIRNVGHTWFNWLTDQLSSGAAGSSQTFVWTDLPNTRTYQELAASLVPQYTSKLPPTDGWGRTYEYREADSLEISQPIAIRSRGADAVWDTDTYSVGPFVTTDYFQDIVWSSAFSSATRRARVRSPSQRKYHSSG